MCQLSRRHIYPCTGCYRPVRSNQQGIFCNKCELWTHARCCGVSKEAYDKLSREGGKLSVVVPTVHGIWASLCRLKPGYWLSTHPRHQFPCAGSVSVTPGCLNSLQPHFWKLYLCSPEHTVSHSQMGRSTGLSGESPSSTYPWVKQNLAWQLGRWCSHLSQHVQVLLKGLTRETWRRHLGLCPRNVRSWSRSDLELDTIEAIWIEIRIGRSSALLCNIYQPLTQTSLPWWPWLHAWACMWWAERNHYHGRYELWHSMSQLSNKPAIIHHGWPLVNPAHHWPNQSYSELPNHHWSLLCLILCLSCILRNCSTSWKWPSHDLLDSTTFQCGESCTHSEEDMFIQEMQPEQLVKWPSWCPMGYNRCIWWHRWQVGLLEDSVP